MQKILPLWAYILTTFFLTSGSLQASITTWEDVKNSEKTLDTYGSLPSSLYLNLPSAKSTAGVLVYAWDHQEHGYKILLGARNDGLGWCSPGGSSDCDGEDLCTIAAREMSEETFSFYATHPRNLSQEPFVDYLHESKIFRMYWRQFRYIPAQYLNAKIKDPQNSHAHQEYSAYQWVSVENIVEQKNLYPPFDNVLRTHAGKTFLSHLAEKKPHSIKKSPLRNCLYTKKSKESQGRFQVRWNLKNGKKTLTHQSVSFETLASPIYQKDIFFKKFPGLKDIEEEQEQLIASKAQPFTIDLQQQILAESVAAHAAAMIEIKKRFTPKAPVQLPEKTTHTDLHLGLYKHLKDPNTPPSPNDQKGQAFDKILEKLDQTSETQDNCLRESYQYMRENSHEPTFVHGVKGSTHHLWRTFAVMNELIGLEHNPRGIHMRGTNLYFGSPEFKDEGSSQKVQIIFTNNSLLSAGVNSTHSHSFSPSYCLEGDATNNQLFSQYFSECVGPLGINPSWGPFWSLFSQYVRRDPMTRSNINITGSLVVIHIPPDSLEKTIFHTHSGKSYGTHYRNLMTINVESYRYDSNHFPEIWVFLHPKYVAQMRMKSFPMSPLAPCLTKRMETELTREAVAVTTDFLLSNRKPVSGHIDQATILNLYDRVIVGSAGQQPPTRTVDIPLCMDFLVRQNHVQLLTEFARHNPSVLPTLWDLVANCKHSAPVARGLLPLAQDRDHHRGYLLTGLKEDSKLVTEFFDQHPDKSMNDYFTPQELKGVFHLDHKATVRYSRLEQLPIKTRRYWFHRLIQENAPGHTLKRFEGALPKIKKRFFDSFSTALALRKTEPSRDLFSGSAGKDLAVFDEGPVSPQEYLEMVVLHGDVFGYDVIFNSYDKFWCSLYNFFEKYKDHIQLAKIVPGTSEPLVFGLTRLGVLKNPEILNLQHNAWANATAQEREEKKLSSPLRVINAQGDNVIQHHQRQLLTDGQVHWIVSDYWFKMKPLELKEALSLPVFLKFFPLKKVYFDCSIPDFSPPGVRNWFQKWVKLVTDDAPTKELERHFWQIPNGEVYHFLDGSAKIAGVDMDKFWAERINGKNFFDDYLKKTQWEKELETLMKNHPDDHKRLLRKLKKHPPLQPADRSSVVGRFLQEQYLPILDQVIDILYPSFRHYLYESRGSWMMQHFPKNIKVARHIFRRSGLPLQIFMMEKEVQDHGQDRFPKSLGAIDSEFPELLRGNSGQFSEFGYFCDTIRLEHLEVNSDEKQAFILTHEARLGDVSEDRYSDGPILFNIINNSIDNEKALAPVKDLFLKRPELVLIKGSDGYDMDTFLQFWHRRFYDGMPADVAVRRKTIIQCIRDAQKKVQQQAPQ